MGDVLLLKAPYLIFIIIMSLFFMPASVVKGLEDLMRSFLWSGDRESNNML